MRLARLARLAELVQLKTGLDGLLVFCRVVVEFFTLCALELDEVILRHTEKSGRAELDGAGNRICTCDLLFTKQLLYR